MLFNFFLVIRIKCGKSYFWQPSVNNLLTVSDKVENILITKTTLTIIKVALLRYGKLLIIEDSF